MKYEPIINSMLDQDLYKITMGSVVFHEFPHAIATYEFFNRGKTPFPEGFADQLWKQINCLTNVQMTVPEKDYLSKRPYLRPTYVDWLFNYQYPTDGLIITQDGGDLKIKFRGPWYKYILWEVTLMGMISELYFKMTGQKMSDDWIERIHKKAKKLSDAGCQWIDFGTRRRFSKEVQDKVVEVMKEYKGFIGTSNPSLANKYNVSANGTYAHESVMAMSALVGPRSANAMWMKIWAAHYNGQLGIALTDTFTTNVFLNNFGHTEARLFDGVRQDSGNPVAWGFDMIRHYKKLGIDPINKRFVFSDNLNDDKYIDIHRQFSGYCQPVGGIGTFLTNDVGAKPLNMVIKLTSIDFGDGNDIKVVKLSDDIGKNTGSSEAIDLVKRELGLCVK